MKPNNFCPISNSKIDEHVARFNASFTVILLISFILTNNMLPILFLLIDFTLRGTENSRYSLLSMVSKQIIETVRIDKKPVNSGPKIFAARIGIIFSLLISVFTILDFTTSAQVFAIIFGICAFLEAAFGFCVACRIYPFVYRFSYPAKFTTNN